VLAEQTPKRLYQARGKLYELLTNCIPAEVRPGVVAGLLGAVTKAGMGTGVPSDTVHTDSNDCCFHYHWCVWCQS
jgi:hypothetical protein